MADLFAPETEASAAVNTARALVLQLALFRATRGQNFEQETPSAATEPFSLLSSASALMTLRNLPSTRLSRVQGRE